MTKNQLEMLLQEARGIISKEGTKYGYAKAFGFLETAVESYLKEVTNDGEQEIIKK